MLTTVVISLVYELSSPFAIHLSFPSFRPLKTLQVLATLIPKRIALFSSLTNDEKGLLPYPIPDPNPTELSYQLRNGLISLISTNKFQNDKRCRLIVNTLKRLFALLFITKIVSKSDTNAEPPF